MLKGRKQKPVFFEFEGSKLSLPKGLLTKIIILSTVVIWIGWDIYTYLAYGNPTTESATLYKWAFEAPGVSFLCGILCGHLFFPQMGVITELTAVEKKTITVIDGGQK